VKHRLGLDFPNLPYLIDARGEHATRPIAITETLAILRHLARTHGHQVSEYALGANDPYVDMIANIVMELNGATARACYGSQSADQAIQFSLRKTNNFFSFVPLFQLFFKNNSTPF